MGSLFHADSHGWDEGITKIRSACDDAGLNSVKMYCHINESKIPFAFANRSSWPDVERLNDFIDRCDNIGRQLILSNIANTDTEEECAAAKRKASERALGYGNKAMLLGSPFNVPTQTLTLLWEEGIVDGVPWEPLMKRRKKL